MLSEQVYFFYKRPIITLPLAILLTSVTSCFVSIFVTLTYMGWIEPFLKVGVQPAIIFLVSMIGLFGWLIAKSVKGWFWLLIVEDNFISLKTFTGKTITLGRDDIQKFEWRKNEVIISTVSERLTFNINVLPIKSKIEFLNILPKWLPLKSLPPEMQTTINEVEKLVQDHPPMLQEPILVSASLKHTMSDMSHFMVTLMIAFFIFSVIYGTLTFLGVGITSLIIILICLIFASVVLWSILNKQVEITNEGIGCQVGFRKKFFGWDDIEAIAVQPYQGQITVWVNGRYSRIPFVGLHPEQLILFEQAFSKQVYARKIPFGYT